MDDLQRKFAAFELRAADDATGEIDGYGSVFGVRDTYGDVVEPGAFAESLSVRTPAMLLQHRMDAPIGKWIKAEEDARGLRLLGRVNLKTTMGRDAYELVKDGCVTGLSIGFRTKSDEMDGPVRRIKEVDLFEVSLVTMPANEAAQVTGVRSDMTERELERRLIGIVSRKEAKALAAAWKELRAQRDVADAGEVARRDAAAALHEIRNILRGTHGKRGPEGAG
jgi:HK97 family phage prohead protease